MKNTEQFFCKVVLIFLVIILVVGCEQEESVVQRMPPNLSGVIANSEIERNPANGRVAVSDQLFAFKGDNLYRVHADTREVEFYGNGWSGTEAATVVNGNIYGVQGGHLWRCNLTTTVCADLGPNWGGTSFLTHDYSGYLYGIQGGKLWKVNATSGAWSQLGIGDWGDATELTYVHSTGWLFIKWGGYTFRVSRSNGSWEQLAGLDPMIHWVSRNTGEVTWGIEDGVLKWVELDGGGGNILSAAEWAGSTDLAFANYESQDPQTECGISSCTISNYFIIKDTELHHLKIGILPSRGTLYNLGPIPGMAGTYLIVSNEGA